MDHKFSHNNNSVSSCVYCGSIDVRSNCEYTASTNKDPVKKEDLRKMLDAFLYKAKSEYFDSTSMKYGESEHSYETRIAVAHAKVSIAYDLNAAFTEIFEMTDNEYTASTNKDPVKKY